MVLGYHFFDEVVISISTKLGYFLVKIAKV